MQRNYKGTELPRKKKSHVVKHVVVGTGGVTHELMKMVEPRFQPENKENRFLWVFSFYDANRNKYENEWDDDDNDNKTR